MRPMNRSRTAFDEGKRVRNERVQVGRYRSKMVIFFISKQNQNRETPSKSDDYFFHIKKFGHKEPCTNDKEVQQRIYPKREQTNYES